MRNEKVSQKRLLNRISQLGALYLNLSLIRAYLEPGSTSFLLKIAISSLVAVVVFFRQILALVRSLAARLGRKGDRAQLGSPTEDEGQPQ